MFNSLILDVAIGLVFVYFILSLLCSVVIEGISSILKWRASMLRQKIGELIKDPEALKNLYANPLFLGETPSYISSRSFVLALLGSLKDHTQVKKELADAPAPLLDSVENIKSLVQNLPEGNYIRTALVPLLDSAQGNLNQALDSMGQWYDEAMERVSGWYKRKSQKVALLLALIVALGLNADTFQISKTLYTDQTVRSTIVNYAQDLVPKEQVSSKTTSPGPAPVRTTAPGVSSPGAGSPPALDKTVLDKNIEILKTSFKMDLPLGWQCKDLKLGFWGAIVKLFGILLTALMVTLGSNFWFELLNRLINLRNSGKKPLTVEEEKAKA